MDRDRGLSRGSVALLGIAAILGLALCTGLARHVRKDGGNLAWDDADYLRRGLRIANRASAQGAWQPGRAIADLLLEQPKPPMLVAWVFVCGSLVPRADVNLLIEASSVVPFGLLVAAVIVVSARRFGPASSPIAVLALAASPLCLAFGAKVMVETFLGLWILLTLHHAALVLDRPTRLRSIGLGSSIGLAMLTKLTVALVLPVPAILFLVLFFRRNGLGRTSLRALIYVALPIVLIAGPWYARNGRIAVDFARFSSRYNVVAEGRSDRTPMIERLESMASRVVGWPALLVLGAGLGVGFRRRIRPEASDDPGDFTLLATSGALGAATILLIPAYFDPRFLLPIWPSLAVVCAGGFLPEGWARPTRFGRGRWAVPTLQGAGTAILLILGVALSVSAISREPRSSTSWAARSLIDELVTSRGVRTIANVGNTADWNVCKTGFLNELRTNPESCFVLHDLSAETPEGLSRRLPRHDVVLLLAPTVLSADLVAGAPGLNRAYALASTMLRDDDRFERIDHGPIHGLPAMSIYVKKFR